ncbi:unannotated protein [freshwater metagenome]|uniref:Unannotated protein n=1 Tax=freshwater metagenome TaxID=449393 RepID=A0A6J7RNB3_9ZZZZ
METRCINENDLRILASENAADGASGGLWTI